jgi:hypothetical protein
VGKRGDRLIHDLNRLKMLIEVPDAGIRVWWNKLHFNAVVKGMEKDGLRRLDGRPTANTLMVKILDEIYVCCWFHRREGSARPPALVRRGSAQVGDDRDGPQPD